MYVCRCAYVYMRVRVCVRAMISVCICVSVNKCHASLSVGGDHVFNVCDSKWL